MIARCPNNSEHARFETTAHVQQLWLVKRNGEFVTVIKDLDTTHPPDERNVWICAECGAQALVDPMSTE